MKVHVSIISGPGPKIRVLYCLVFSILLSLWATSAFAQITFTDVTEAAGLLKNPPTSGARSATWGDYDNDGDPDVILMNGKIRLYRNEGNGTFLDVTQVVGIPDTSFSSSIGNFADYDNDGDLDLFLGTERGDSLYENDGNGAFLDISQAAGIQPRQSSHRLFAAAFFDYDRDGFLDIYVSNYETPNFLYHNEGNGHFQEVAAQLGVDKPESIGYSMGVYCMGSILGDYDNDVDLDLFITVDGEISISTGEPPGARDSAFYRNDGNGVFVDVVQQAGIQHRANHNGFFWDYDNDGDLDLFLQGHLNQIHPTSSAAVSNFLYRNNGDGTFTDIIRETGIESFERSGFGASFGDYDNDGWMDVVITYDSLPTFLYHNNGDGTFTDVGGETGLGGANTGVASFVDYDSDGDLDIFIGAGEHMNPTARFASNPTLYRSDGSTNHWLQLRLIGRQSNRDSVGARVKVIAGGLTMMREIAGGSARTISQQDRLPLHFGLGSNVLADVIEVRWPSGITQTLTDIPGNQRLTIDEFEGTVIVIRKSSPGVGDPEGGIAVQIQGEHFLPGSRVFFGGVEVRDVRVASPMLMTVFTPPGQSGYVDVEVVHPDGKRGILQDGFRYSTLRISRISPESGPVKGGIKFQIDGVGFQNGTQVDIGGKALTNIIVTPTWIEGTLPPGIPGSVDVSVTNPDGEWDALSRSFTYIPPPEIEEISPIYAPLKGGQDIQIRGSGFHQALTAQIGGVTAGSVEFISTSEVNVRTPEVPDIGFQDVVIINPDGQRAILRDGIIALAPIEIESIDPDSGVLAGGTMITIVGKSTVEIIPTTDERVDIREYSSRFVEGVEVFIGDARAGYVTLRSDNVIIAIAPPNTPGLKDVVVVNPDGSEDTLRNAFAYNNLPHIAKITPDNGRLAGGTEITIQGSGFLPGAKVLIGIEGHAYKPASSVEVVSSTVITAVTPPDSEGTRIVMVFNPDQQYVVLEEGFTYNAMPAITGITPDYGSSSGGTKVVIEGTGFLQGARVMIGDKAATAQVEDDTTIEATAPAIPKGVWDVRVINPDTQEVVKQKGFISVGEVAYNYPNPFRASQGTTFRYVTNDVVESITVKVFNLAGVPIDVVQQTNSNEVKWQNGEVHAGIYVYLMEVELEDGKTKQFRSMLEVYK